MNPEFRSHFFADARARASFEVCAREVFGLDFTFLFTDNTAAGSYDRLGLKRQPEFATVVRLSPGPTAPADALRRLDLDERRDYQWVAALAAGREMVSDRLGWKNPNLLLFRFLYAYRDCSYYAPALEAVIVAETARTRLRLHDVVTKGMPSWSELEPLLGSFGRDTIEVLFGTDRLRPGGSTAIEVADSLLFVDERFELTGPFVFPYSIRAWPGTATNGAAGFGFLFRIPRSEFRVRKRLKPPWPPLRAARSCAGA